MSLHENGWLYDIYYGKDFEGSGRVLITDTLENSIEARADEWGSDWLDKIVWGSEEDDGDQDDDPGSSGGDDEPPKEALFSDRNNTVDFNTRGEGAYIAGTQFDALEGHDTVTLPSTVSHGFTVSGSSLFEGGSGNDRISGAGGEISYTISGGDHNDVLYGGDQADILFGGAGATDKLFGNGGDDVLVGGLAADGIGQAALDLRQGHIPAIVDDGERDILNGGDGSDVIYAGKDDLIEFEGIAPDHLVTVARDLNSMTVQRIHGDHPSADVDTIIGLGDKSFELKFPNPAPAYMNAGKNKYVNYATIELHTKNGQIIEQFTDAVAAELKKLDANATLRANIQKLINESEQGIDATNVDVVVEAIKVIASIVPWVKSGGKIVDKSKTATELSSKIKDSTGVSREWLEKHEDLGKLYAEGQQLSGSEDDPFFELQLGLFWANILAFGALVTGAITTGVATIVGVVTAGIGAGATYRTLELAIKEQRAILDVWLEDLKDAELKRDEIQENVEALMTQFLDDVGKAAGLPCIRLEGESHENCGATLIEKTKSALKASGGDYAHVGGKAYAFGGGEAETWDLSEESFAIAQLRAGDGADKVVAGNADDAVYGEAGDDWLEGGDGWDRLDGGDGDDVLIDRAGGAEFYGGAGKDRIIAGAMDDVVDGGADRDVIKTSGGADEVFGGEGDDVVLAGLGDDDVDGGEGNDVIKTAHGADRIWGGDGDDIVLSGVDDDEIHGGDGNDVIKPSYGEDLIEGDAGDDVVIGFRGDETLIGGDGNDKLLGNLGDDVINGGPGDDRMQGGPGRDRFVIDLAEFGNDKIVLDFRPRSDVIDFSGSGLSAEDMTVKQAGANVKITFDGVSSSLLVNAQRFGGLDVANFDDGVFIF